MTGTQLEYTTENTKAHELAESRLRASGAERIDRADSGRWHVFGALSHPLPVRVLVADTEGWPVSFDDACPIEDTSGDIGFWILVDPEATAMYVIPDHWIRHDIDERQVAQLVCTACNGAHGTPEPPFIDRQRVERWRDRWDLIETLLR